MSATATDLDLQRQCEEVAMTLTSPANWIKEYRQEHMGDEPDADLLHIGANEWLGQTYDIRYTVSQAREFIYAEVMVAGGGPTIWVNFDTYEVEGYHGGDKAVAPFSDNLNVKDALEAMWEEGTGR